MGSANACGAPDLTHGPQFANSRFSKLYWEKWASVEAQSVKNLPVMRETWVWFLGREDPLEKEMATYSSIIAWRIPWTEQPGRLQFMGLQESDMT